MSKFTQLDTIYLNLLASKNQKNMWIVEFDEQTRPRGQRWSLGKLTTRDGVVDSFFTQSWKLFPPDERTALFDLDLFQQLIDNNIHVCSGADYRAFFAAKNIPETTVHRNYSAHHIDVYTHLITMRQGFSSSGSFSVIRCNAPIGHSERAIANPTSLTQLYDAR